MYLAQRLAVRLAGVAAVVTFALAIYARSLDLLRTEIPLQAANGRMFWIASLIAAIGLGMTVERVAHRLLAIGRRPHRIPDTGSFGAAVLPALVVFAALQLAAWDSRTIVIVAAPLLAGAGVFTALVVRAYLLAQDPATFRGARSVHVVLTAGVGFLSMSLARSWMAGPVYTLVVVAVISGVLLYQAFDGIRAFAVRRGVYALTGAVVVGELAYALSYWPASGWYAGAMLTTVLVVLMLIVALILERRMSTDGVARYIGAGVGVCGLLTILAR